VRELLDNALDSGASSIEVRIEGGGVRLVEVIDNGCGIDRESLSLASQKYATSKIRSLDDLSTARTLGFRGEALSSIAAVAALEILTSADGESAHRMEVGPPPLVTARISEARRVKGTTVRARRLFDSIPARKRFLKREAAEAASCRAVFLDKALAHPGTAFRFTQEGEVKFIFPESLNYRDRYCAALLLPQEAFFLHEIAASGPGFTVNIVAGSEEIARGSRDRQFIFANGRRINDFSMQQALEYGCQGAFPNGEHPQGALFIQIDPALADFNIHPAKKEARFTCAPAIHHAVTEALRDFTAKRVGARGQGHDKGAGSREQGSGEWGVGRREVGNGKWVSASNAQQTTGKSPGSQAASQPLNPLPTSYFPFPISHSPFPTLRYIGKIFNLFILIETEGRLLAIDQHAAHERLLFERCLARPVPSQELLVPIPFTTDDEAGDMFLEQRQAELARLGVRVSGGGGAWQIDALPELWRLGDSETVRSLLNLAQAGENAARRWAETIACHAAIKEGDELDSESALRLASEALSLPDHRCPHGRPFVVEITQEALLKAVKRA